jgi:ethanolamine utilization protein EutA
MGQTREIVSVGIDIGTTTTQVVFSHLSLVDVARPGQIPHIDISSRKIIYQSPVVFTPLLSPETIDAPALAALLRQEYSAAGVLPTQVESGAVIITGETAKKTNADTVLQAISDLAGDFVVTVAGPHVESLIAGRGSGASEYSRRHYTNVTNLDVGGGSANSALFRMGDLVCSAAMNFGGRVIEIERTSGRIRHLTQPARVMLAHLGINMEEGSSPTLQDLQKVADCMAGLAVELLEGKTSPLAQKLYLTHPAPFSSAGQLIMLSGGVGYYFYHPISIQSVSDAAVHDDIGPLLANALRAKPALQNYPLVEPAETLRATVLGASSQMVALSGSTIWVDANILPLKNVPVVRPDLPGWPIPSGAVAAAIQAALQRWDLDADHDLFAVALEFDHLLNYPELAALASELAGFAAALPAQRPLVVIVKRDYAQSLGQTIKASLDGHPLIVIDQVGLEEGNYMDIGQPLMDGRVVPVSVKTLVFYH